jgi:hypothetical protein
LPSERFLAELSAGRIYKYGEALIFNSNFQGEIFQLNYMGKKIKKHLNLPILN